MFDDNLHLDGVVLEKYHAPINSSNVVAFIIHYRESERVIISNSINREIIIYININNYATHNQ